MNEEEQKLKEAAQLIKDMCSKRKFCIGCIFQYVANYTAPPCKLINRPDRWDVD